ncbi:MAG: family 1 glycosylhydrolase [Gemmatimonadaceae bacterium]
MSQAHQRPELQLWAGLECTLNRVGSAQHDQLALTGHHDRPDDIDRLAALGLRTLRYPILWERFAGRAPDDAAWRDVDARMERMRAAGIDPIIGLVHHGSGPLHTHLLHDDFADGLAEFARTVAERYPWVTRFTPVNEPLTTARFSALYGHWYPHERSDALCWRATLNQIRAIRLAMDAIRAVTPEAQLVQTEDLGHTHATPALAYQAEFENERRWLTFDLLTGRVVPGHRMYDHALFLGLHPHEIARAVGDGCPPDLIGINHYVTSERWLDERLEHYPPHTHGGNHAHRYADVEAVRVLPDGVAGPRALLLETWERYRLPIAVTEAHMGCSREQQLRWLRDVWQAAGDARACGADVRAVTAWAAFGTRDWSSLVTRLDGHYEPGLFDVRAPAPRPTALAAMARTLAERGTHDHPALDAPGWWHLPERILYQAAPVHAPVRMHGRAARPILVTGAAGTLGRAFTRICAERGLAVRAVTRAELDVAVPNDVARVLRDTNAWAVVNAAGYVRVDDAEHDRDGCRRGNVEGAVALAAACAARGIPLVTFSSDLVFDGSKSVPYLERDAPAPLGVYGATKADAESRVLSILPEALVVRTAAFFGPWDDWNFVTLALRSIADGVPFAAASDLVVSPTYVPDLVHATLDLLIDGERGIWHLSNPGAATWADFARMAARAAGLDASLVHARPHAALGLTARRPRYAALASERAALMSSLEHALARYVRSRPWESVGDNSPTALSIESHGADTYLGAS